MGSGASCPQTFPPSRLPVILFFGLTIVACGKGASPSAPSGAGGSGDTAGAEEEAAPAPMDAREAAQWERAKDGDPEEAMRLADLVGCTGLRERAASRPELRATALRAMRYCGDFSELPWLAQVASGKDDAEAQSALVAVVDMAARPRRSTDPEDAQELHDGCAALLSLARSTDRPRTRRVLAIRALRMLAERGCVRAADIPTELDAH